MIESEAILVLAHDVEMRRTLAIAIAEETHHPIVPVADAAEAVRLAQLCRPIAIVLDLGLDGDCAALRAVREEAAIGCPTIALGPAFAREAAQTVGASAFVAEPVDMAAVLLAVGAALLESRAMVGGRAA